MKLQKFNELRTNFNAKREKLLTEKWKDYRWWSEDVLANFINMSQRLDISPEQALAIYMGKHFDAIYSYCKNHTIAHSEPIEERIADAINYLELLLAMVEERNNPLDINK